MLMSSNEAQDPENRIYETSIHGNTVGFKESQYCPHEGVRNLNLLGTDFLDNYCFIDDYMSSMLVCLLRKVDGTKLSLPSW